MKKQREIQGKLMYDAPQVNCIEIDNEISLALESDPPNFEGDNNIHLPEQFISDPFKSDVC